MSQGLLSDPKEERGKVLQATSASESLVWKMWSEGTGVAHWFVCQGPPVDATISCRRQTLVECVPSGALCCPAEGQENRVQAWKGCGRGWIGATVVDGAINATGTVNMKSPTERNWRRLIESE